MGDGIQQIFVPLGDLGMRDDADALCDASRELLRRSEGSICRVSVGYWRARYD
jgi:hypothetical protein